MGSDGKDETSGGGANNAIDTGEGRHLFGLSGATKPPETGGSSASSPPLPTPSSPYPRDATYTPRPPEPDSIFTDVDDEGELTRLHPNYKLLMRVGAIVLAVLVVILGLIADAVISDAFEAPFGIATGIAVLIALFIALRIPVARYNARGYQISRDRLRVVRGIMWHSDTIVPFGRVQHIDVDQGPIERGLGLATLTLHTAGSHNASVRLPGLGHELAVQMREEIRAHIKRESV